MFGSFMCNDSQRNMWGFSSKMWKKVMAAPVKQLKQDIVLKIGIDQAFYLIYLVTWLNTAVQLSTNTLFSTDSEFLCSWLTCEDTNWCLLTFCVFRPSTSHHMMWFLPWGLWCWWAHHSKVMRWGSDPCSRKYGVKEAFAGQYVSLFLTNFCILHGT